MRASHTSTARAVVFPGQGAQRQGMAQDCFESFAESRRVFDTVSEAIGVDMAQLCFEEDERLHQTEFTQPAILTAEIAMWRAIKKRYNFEAKYFGGHSLGEYAALVAAGVIPLGDAAQIVHKRGALMQQAAPPRSGAMAALIYDNILQCDFLDIVHQAGAQVANYNSLQQVVISGPKTAVETAESDLKQRYPDMRVIFLDVSAPFHCSLMDGIAEEFEGCLRAFEGSFNLERATCVLSNYAGGFHKGETLIEHLVCQASGSVQWVTNMERLKEVADSVFEIGPTRVLGKFCAEVGIPVNTIVGMRTLRKHLGECETDGLQE